MIAQGFSKFTAVALDGTKSDASAGGNAGAAPVASAPAAAVTSPAAVAPEASAVAQCGGTTLVTVTRAVSKFRMKAVEITNENRLQLLWNPLSLLLVSL